MAKINDFEDDDDSSGGQSGQVEFRDFLASNDETRDDLLSSEQRKIKLSEHNYSHEARVKAQKDKRDHYKDLKNGKIPLEVYRADRAGMGEAKYKSFPLLANSAQFAGKDPQTNSIPNDKLDTNMQDQEELQLRLGQKLQAQPRFNPKPNFP